MPFLGAGLMAQLVKVLSVHQDNPSSIPRIHVLAGEHWLSRVVLLFPNVLHDMFTSHTQRHIK